MSGLPPIPAAPERTQPRLLLGRPVPNRNSGGVRKAPGPDGTRDLAPGLLCNSKNTVACVVNTHRPSPHSFRMIGANLNRPRRRAIVVGATFVLVGAFCSLSPALHRLGVGTPPEKFDPLFGLGSIILGVQPEAEPAEPAELVTDDTEEGQAAVAARGRTPEVPDGGQAPARDDVKCSAECEGDPGAEACVSCCESDYPWHCYPPPQALEHRLETTEARLAAVEASLEARYASTGFRSSFSNSPPPCPPPTPLISGCGSISSCGIDEEQNSNGPHRCSSDSDCAGCRTCSGGGWPGWCQGRSKCNDCKPSDTLYDECPAEDTVGTCEAVSHHGPHGVNVCYYGLYDMQWSPPTACTDPHPGKKFVCTGKASGGWGVHQAHNHDCTATSPESATSSHMYAPNGETYSCYFGCAECNRNTTIATETPSLSGSPIDTSLA